MRTILIVVLAFSAGSKVFAERIQMQVQLHGVQFVQPRQAGRPINFNAAPAPRRGFSFGNRVRQILRGIIPQRISTGNYQEEFLYYINFYRASINLPPVSYNQLLTNQAAGNNGQQQHRRGIGHFFLGNARRQNAGFNYASAYDVFLGWCYSPGHLALFEDPSIRNIGLAWHHPWWTLNAN